MAVDVLIVDDDADLRAPLAELLRDEGYLVEEHGSAKDLLRKIADAQPKLILLDLTLPGGNLRSLLAEARQTALLAGRVVLALSGLDDAAELATELGLNGAVRKPFDVMSLLARVDAVCGRGSGRSADSSLPVY
jgi:DNA-binding response OmpR family regulator